MRPKVSIIIPVYKAERYIRRCLDSVVHQSGDSYEVVIIDDGSPDHSGTVCDQYAVQYPFLRVFHQKNGGVSKARVAGVRQARGQYILWVDADDVAHMDLVKDVVDAFEKTKADIVLYGAQSIENGQLTDKQMPRRQKARFIQRGAVTGEYSTLWQLASRRELWNNESIPEEVKWAGEDGYMCLRLLMKTGTVEVIPKVLYYHEINNPNSLRHSVSARYYMGNSYLWYYRLHVAEKEFPDLSLHCANRAFSGAVKAYCLSLVMQDFPTDYRVELIRVIHDLRAYPISGRWRDKFLAWCIMHHVNGPCKQYAWHKVQKAQRRNDVAQSCGMGR